MQKISGIIPSSARVQSTDLANSSPVRPGVPSFGQPIGTSTGSRHRVAPSTADLANQELGLLTQKRSKEQEKADIVKNISDGFFMKNKNRERDLAIDTGFVSPVITRDPLLETDDSSDSPTIGRYLDVAV